jgi:Tfp pilus assembly protein PilF
VGPAADPGKAEQHYQEGLALKQAGRLAEAHAALRAALEADPNHVDAHWARAWVLIELGDRDGAKSEFRKVLELAPTGDKAADAQAALERLNEQ